MQRQTEAAIFSSTDVMVGDRCTECNVGLVHFCIRYCGKARDLFDLCVRHKLILEKKDCEKCGKALSKDE